MKPCVRAKSGVRFDVIAPAGFVLLAAMQRICDVIQKDVVITCGTDSHTLPDPHCTGEAYDISVSGYSADDIQKVLGVFGFLGTRFYAQYEVSTVPSDPTLRVFAVVNPRATGPHIHSQRAKGTVYP